MVRRNENNDNSNRHTCALPIHNTYTSGKERENVKGIWIILIVFAMYLHTETGKHKLFARIYFRKY